MSEPLPFESENARRPSADPAPPAAGPLLKIAIATPPVEAAGGTSAPEAPTELPPRAPEYRRWVAVLIGAVAVLLAVLAFNRDYVAFGTETDFLGLTVREGARILAGEPLRLSFHPPAYAFAVTAVYLMVEDWVVSGLIIAVIAAVLAMWGTFLLFRSMALEAAGVGAVIALAASPVFLGYSVMATADTFFFALYTGCLLFTSLAVRRPDSRWWLVAGLCLGVALLARSNAISLLVLLAAPLVQRLPWRLRARNFALLAVMLLGIAGVWWGYAQTTGSRLWTEGNHRNLAMTYFAPGADRASFDALVAASAPFESIGDVLRHDPVRLARTYLRDGYETTQRLFGNDGLLTFPLNLLALPGLLLLVGAARRTPMLGWVLIAAATQLLLVNFKTYEARYYLFLLPLLGAGAAACWQMVSSTLPGRRIRYAVASAFALVLLGGAAQGLKENVAALHADAQELSESVPLARAMIPQDALLLARKPHLSYYSGARPVLLPDVSNLDELRQGLASARGSRPIFLYYGSAERWFRPRLAELQHGDGAPDWLLRVGRSSQPGIWALYRVDRDRLEPDAPLGPHGSP